MSRALLKKTIHEISELSDPSSYRPIAITSMLMMKWVVNTQLLGYLKDHKLISDRQCKFRHKHYAKSLENKGLTVAAFLEELGVKNENSVGRVLALNLI